MISLNCLRSLVVISKPLQIQRSSVKNHLCKYKLFRPLPRTERRPNCHPYQNPDLKSTENLWNVWINQPIQMNLTNSAQMSCQISNNNYASLVATMGLVKFQLARGHLPYFGKGVCKYLSLYVWHWPSLNSRKSKLNSKLFFSHMKDGCSKIIPAVEKEIFKRLKLFKHSCP